MFGGPNGDNGMSPGRVSGQTSESVPVAGGGGRGGLCAEQLPREEKEHGPYEELGCPSSVLSATPTSSGRGARQRHRDKLA